MSPPDISQEFIQVNLEQRAGRPRLEVWKNLADRSEIEEFTSFVSMLRKPTGSAADRSGAEPLLRRHSIGAEATGRGGRGKDQEQDQDHLSACAVYLPMYLYRAAGPGADEYCEWTGRNWQITGHESMGKADTQLMENRQWRASNMPRRCAGSGQNEVTAQPYWQT